ncbi:MAG: NADH-quinone oxidoreductase subunit NuoG [Mariprofundus sp.]|nr:NADH-quinone oxidoreductase subunit NuoG [Mariprofundus sp.]
MTSLFINEQEVEVAAGTSILEACREYGHDVPYFCYHPELSVAANCRMCLVEVEGWNKPAASCCTPVGEGMKVITQSPSLEKDREMMMEYLLIHHPLDCPVCDQGGSCKLQDYTVDHGASRGRYSEPKRAVVNYELGPFVNTCMTRCIHCTRCVRFADEVAGTGDIGVLNRSDHMTIAGIVEEALESELSGNLPDICPVGALLDKPSHDVSRPWEMTHHQSTCTQCPNGCDIQIESRDDEVMRIQPIENSPEPWICDRGRYVYDAFRSEHRILAPKVRQNGELSEVDWDAAFAKAKDILKGKRIGILFSPDWSVEGQAAIRLMRDTTFPDAHIAYDLHRRDMRPFAFEEGFAMTTAQIADADQVVVLGSDPRQRLPLLMQRLRKRGNAGKPVSRIGAMNYRTNMSITDDALIRPRDWPAVIARAMEQVSVLGKTAAGFETWLAAVPERHEAGKILADALMSDGCALLVGEEIRSHADAAALIYGLDLLMRACGHAEKDNDGRNLLPEGMNTQVLSASCGDVRVSAGDLFAAAAAGELDALIVIGSDPLGDGLFPSAAKAALANVPMVQIGAISGAVSEHAAVQLPAAAYAEIEGTFVNMEGRIRVASNPIRSLGQERPLWKVMMRMVQVMGGEVPVVDLAELRDVVRENTPALADAWQDGEQDQILIKPARNKGLTTDPKAAAESFDLDVVSRYSMYREGMWVRASEALTEAGNIHALDDVLVHPDTLVAHGLIAGENTVRTFLGESTYHIGARDDVSPGVLFISKRGVAGDLSDVSEASIAGGSSS